MIILNVEKLENFIKENQLKKESGKFLFGYLDDMGIIFFEKNETKPKECNLIDYELIGFEQDDVIKNKEYLTKYCKELNSFYDNFQFQ